MMRRLIVTLVSGLTAAPLFVPAASASPALAPSNPGPTVAVAERTLVPVPPPIYTVVAGDTLGTIGATHGMAVPQLVTLNQIPDANFIVVGQLLRLNGSVPIPEVAPSPPVTVVTVVTVPRANVSTSAPKVGSTPVHSVSTASSPSSSGVWACIAQHESGGDPSINTGNGYYGMYQDTLSSWAAAGGVGNPANASASEQLAVNQRIQQQQGWNAWPVTSRMCGA